ncbi:MULTISPECIES: hypothetical protein [Polaribacter]|uniref:DUF5077 domain-containing protein n=1 Tax=Polaribacter sejongensis TaxID=985043 RepID=A0ABM6Q2B5_9FLAO|nr:MULTISPECIES: hypothetical protein [Polaribacter]AUC23369.1 hypothetical protein BTO15_15240 [Polaribacter sejongensis]
MRQLSKEMKPVSYYIKNGSLSVLLLNIILLISAQNTNAQKDITNEDYNAFSVEAHVKNMHLWHGGVVHSGAMIATSLEYNSKNKKFTFGLWGGASFSSIDVNNTTTGETESAFYKEVSIYTKYRFSDRFFIEAVSHNNYTGVEERGDELKFWSYDKTQGYNFVDVSFGYNVTPNTLLYLATIINGGSGDYEVQADGSLKNSWTHYFEVNSKVWEKGDANLSLFAGGAWSFTTDKTFYTESAANIINVGATLNKDIKIGNYNLPIGVTAMWNPEQEKTVLQLDLTLF